MRSENYVCVQKTDVNMATQGDDNKVVCSTNVNKELERNLITLYKKFDVILNNKNESFTRQSESIVEVWHCLTKCKFEKSDLDYAIQIMDWAKLNTLNIVLAGEWKKYKGQYQDALLKEVKATQNQLKKVHSMFDTRCQKLLIVINNPWSDPTLEYLVRTPNAEIGPKEIEFFCVETAYLIAVRLKKLCESQCEDLALNLVKAFMKCYRQQQVGNFNLNATETQVWFIFDMHVALLYKFKENDSLLEMLKGVSAEEGLNIITRFANKRVEISKIWKHCHRIAILAAKVYISSTILKPIDEIHGILRELLRVYVLLNNSEEFLKDVVESVRSIIRLAETAAHIYIFCDVFQEQFETKMKTFIIELYIRALTTDMNLLERQKADNEKDKLVETSRRLANGFTNLAEVLKGDVNVSRECILTAFSLQPTTDRMKKIEELAKVSGLEVLDTGQEWKCKLHPPILPSDDVAWICTSCGEYMCKPQLNVPLNTNIALNEALTEEKLGITRELCDDLVVLLSCPRYQVFSWLLDWPDLQRLCVMYLDDPERTKNFVTELKFLDIDYSMFVNIKKEPLDEYAGIERGYEHYLDHEFNSDDDQISCASEDTASQESRFFNLSCDSASDLFCLPGVPKKSDPNTLKSLRLFRPSLKRSRNNAESTVVPEKVLKSDLADFAIPCSSKQTDLTPPIVNSSKPSNNVTLEIDSANISNQYFLPIQGYTKGSLNSFSSLETRPTAAPAMKPLFSSQNIAQPIKTYANQFNHNNHLDSTYYKAYPGKSATTITNQTATPQLNCDISRVPSIGNPKNGQVATLQQVGGQVAVQKSPTKMPMDSGLILGSHNTSNNSEFQLPQTADTTSRQIRESPQESTILCQNKPPSLAIVNLLDSPSSVVTSKMDVENTECRNVRDTDEFRYVNSEALESISLNMHQDNQDIANGSESDISEPTNNSSQANICENKTDISTDVVKSNCDLPAISDRRDQFTHGVPNLFEDFETEEYLEPTPSEHLHAEMLELIETRYAIPNLKSYSKKKNNLEKNFAKTRTKTKTSVPPFSDRKDEDQLNISLEDNTAGYADTLISSESEYDCFSETNPILQNVLSKIDSFEKDIVIAVTENKPGPSYYGDKSKSVATKIKSKGKGCTISPSDHCNKETEPGPSNYKGKGKSIAKEIKHKGKGCTKKRGKSRSRREPKYESYPDTGSDSQVDVDSDDQFNRCYIELFKNNLLYDTIEGVCKNIDFYLKSKSKCTSSDLSSKRGKEIKKSIPSKKNRKMKIKNTSEKTVLDVGSKSKPKSDYPIRDIRVIINRIPEAVLRSLQPVQNDFPVLDMMVLGSTNSASPRSNEENSNDLHDVDNEGERAPDFIRTNPGSIDNVSPVSIATIDNRNQNSTRSNGFRDADRENNNLPKGVIRTSEHCDNDSPVSIIAVDDADEDLTRSNKHRSNGLRKADKEDSRLAEVTIRISERNDSPVSIVSIDDRHEDLAKSHKERTNGLRDSDRENMRLPEVTVRASECINLDSPVSVVVLCDSDNDSPRSKKKEAIDSYNAGKDVSADNGSPKSNTEKAYGLRDADKENNNVLPEVLVRSFNRIDNDSPISVEVIDDKDNSSPRSNKEKGSRNDSEEINRFSELLVESFRRINNDSPASVVVIDDTDNDSPRSNNENSNGLRNVVEENGLSEILLSSSRRIDNDSPASVLVIDDLDNGSPKSKENANVRSSRRTDNDSPASVVLIGDSDNDSPRSKKEQANVSRNTHKWKGKTIKISDADKENSGLPVAFMRSSGRIAIYTPASEILVLDESDNDSPRSNKGSPNAHHGAGKENSSSLNSSLSPESTRSKDDGNAYNNPCDILVNSADNPKSDQNQNIGCTTKTTCNKTDILSGNLPYVRNNNTVIRPDDSKDGTVEGETSKVSVERLSVNDSSYVRSVLANIPGLHDTELIRPTNTNMVVNVVQIAGGRNNASVPVANAQTSTQVTPHIQRIGQPRFEKPQNDQPDNGSPIVTSVATSVSNSVKPSTSQPSTLINILSQQVIRPGQSNYARTRPSPLINIVSHQIIRPSTQVVPKMTTTSAQTNEQVNDAPKPETPSEQPASTIVTSAVKNIATTVKTAASVASSPAPGTILQFICKSATLPKFQQAFGKTVYHANNVETTDATSSGENSNSSSDTNKKPPVKSSTVNIQPLQGSVIYTRQVPVGQAINLIPPGRQVFRIATSNPDQISLVKDSVIHSKMSALLTAALQGKKTTEVVEGDGNDERVTVTRPTLVQSARIVKPVIQIPSNVIRTNTNTQSNLSSTTLEQLREFDMVYKQIKERSNTGPTPSESSTQSESENPPHGISVTYLNQGQKFTQLSPVVVVSSYCNLQPAASPALSVTSQGSSSPCVTPAPTPTLPKVSSKTASKGKSLKNASTHISKSSPVPKPQQKPQEDEHTTQRIFDILAEYAEQLRNSPDLNNKPAPRRRSNPPTNPNHNSKRKKSSGSKKPGTTGSAISESDLEDQRTIGSEDSSCGIVQLSVKDEEQVQNQRTESNDSTTSTRPLILTETNSNSTTRNLIIADSSVGEALKLQNTAVLVPGNYIMPVSMVKGGQQIAVVSGGSKILATVPARSGPNMLLFQSFLNQNRKPGVPTVKYSTLQPISGISSQNLASVSGQSSVILPQTTHNLTAVTLGQPLTLKKMEDSDNRVNTELLLAIAQPRERANATENSTLPDSSTSIQNSNSIKLDVNNVRINNSSEKIYTYQKSPITAPIATPVISQTAQVENGSDDNSTSAQPSIITLNIAADNKDGASRTAKRVQSVLVAACTSNGPMLSHTPPRYRKASESTPINSEVNMKGAYLHNGEKQKDEHKHFQTTAVYFPTKTKKSVSHPAKLDRELHQLCLQRKQAAIERELRLQKSLSEECEDLGVDEPSTSDLFPEADLLFDSNHSPSFDQTSQDVVRKAMHLDKDKSIMLFSDDDNSSSLRTDFLFDSVQYQTEGELQYEQSRQLTNGQSSTSNESGSSCEDNTLLQNCASMSDVTLNSPISPEFTDNPTHMNKYKFKYSNRKKAERHKQVETWTASGEVSSSEDTMCSELGKMVHSPKGCVIKRGSHSSSCDEDEEFKVVRIAISKTDLAKDDESCEELHYDDDLDSPSSGRGARRSVKKMCSCCNGAQEGNRKRPSSRPHTPALHKKAFLNKKR